MKLSRFCLLILLISSACNAIGSSRMPLILGAGALVSTTAAIWAHKKIKALSESAKRNPDAQKSLTRWKIARNMCGIIATGLGTVSIVSSRYTRHIRKLERELQRLKLNLQYAQMGLSL